MRYRNQIVLLGIAAAAFGVGRWTSVTDFSSVALGQPEKKDTSKPAQPGQPGQPGMMTPDAMKKMQDAISKGMPGPEHKNLDVLVGDWKGSVKMWMDPSSQPMESKGTIHREWVLDGHFVHEMVDGDAMGPGAPAYKGMGVTGYNTVEKRYESGWVDNTVTWVTTMSGAYDAGKKTFSYSGDCIDPMQNKRVKTRTTLDCSNPDREVMTSWSTGADGKEYKAFEGTFERVTK